MLNLAIFDLMCNLIPRILASGLTLPLPVPLTCSRAAVNDPYLELENCTVVGGDAIKVYAIRRGSPRLLECICLDIFSSYCQIT